MHIAIITGGPSEEREISLASARLITDHIDKEKYSYHLLVMEGNRFIEEKTGQVLDLNDFSLDTPAGKKVFDFAFLMIHGRPAEDGKLQGYLEFMGIPYSTSGVLASALTFNKQMCKNYLRPYGIPMADSILVNKEDKVDIAQFNHLDLPVFVKPNNNGSSVAVTKLHNWEGLEEALEKVWAVDTEALVEQFIAGIEYSASILKYQGEYLRFPITEIRTRKEFFDYEAKYHGASEEITPARLPDDLVTQCLDLSENIYRVLNCEGVCRLDFILRDKHFYFLELNTIPGMSPASMVPQQVLAKGWTISHFIDLLIESKPRR